MIDGDVGSMPAGSLGTLPWCVMTTKEAAQIAMEILREASMTWPNAYDEILKALDISEISWQSPSGHAEMMAALYTIANARGGRNGNI